MPDETVFGQDPEQFRAKVKMVEEHVATKPVEQQEKIRKTMLADMTREQAIAWGKALGEDEADKRREYGAMRDERIRRAMAYAAWEFDGKPSGGAHLKEFKLTEADVIGSLERALPA